VDASFPGIQLQGSDFWSYRITVEEATQPAQYTRKDAVAGAVSFKLGWAFEGASFRPGKWDKDSWSISGTGSVCCDQAYQRPWFFANHRSYPVGFKNGAVIESATHENDDGSIDIFFRVDGYDIASPLETKQSTWWRWWTPWEEKGSPQTPVFRISPERIKGRRLMPALAGGINFGNGWAATLQKEISHEFRRDVTSFDFSSGGASSSLPKDALAKRHCAAGQRQSDALSEPPRMWWLKDKGSEEWCGFAVEWNQSELFGSCLQSVGAFQATQSSEHPWPEGMEAKIRALRRVDPDGIHHMSWCFNDGLNFFGIASNQKQQRQALGMALLLGQSILKRHHAQQEHPFQQIALKAATLEVDSECILGVPTGGLDHYTWGYAVCQCKFDKVTGFFFPNSGDAERFFDQVKCGEHPTILLNSEGEEVKKSGRKDRAIMQKFWNWWKGEQGQEAEANQRRDAGHRGASSKEVPRGKPPSKRPCHGGDTCWEKEGGEEHYHPPAQGRQETGSDGEPPKKRICGSKDCKKPENPADNKFCGNCGRPLDAEDVSDVEVIGFSLGGLQEQIAPDDWEEFHAAVIRARSVKEEAGAFSSELFTETGEMEEVELRDVLCLQENIGRHFRNRLPLESLIRDLGEGNVDPMTTPWLALRVAKAECRDATKYYTFDHRRLWCMWKADVRKIRVQIALKGQAFNEFARKCESLGRHVSQLRVRGRRC